MAGIAAVTALAALPATASAATQYAAQGGGALADCTNPAQPCNLLTATSNAAPGDTVQVAPGDYDAGTDGVPLTKSVTLQGTPGAARPRIFETTNNVPVIGTAGGATVTIRHLRVEQLLAAGSQKAIDASDLGSATINDVQVVANSSAEQATGIAVGPGDVVSDSTVLVNGSAGGTAIQALGTGAGPMLHNVTAWALGTASNAISASNLGTVVTATNTIARAPQAPADLSAGTAGVFTMTNSSYATKDGNSNDSTSVGTQTTPPALADPANGDFHELASSPTIDAGLPDPLSGLTDPDRDARILGLGTDIGADEFVPPSPTLGNPLPPGVLPGNKPQLTGLNLPANITVGRPVNFQVTSSDPDGPVNSIAIDFGDGPGYFAESACRYKPLTPIFTQSRSATFTVPYSFARPGAHTVTITVGSGQCGRDQQTTTQTVQVNVGSAKSRAARIHARTMTVTATAAGCKGADAMPTAKNHTKIERATFCLLNGQRRANKLKPLRWNKKLRRAAALHNTYMAKGGFFAHKGPGEPALGARFRKAKYPGGGGENLGSGSGVPYATPRSMVIAWMNSPVHRANVLERAFHTVGIAVIPQLTAPSAPGATYTTEFGTTKK